MIVYLIRHGHAEDRETFKGSDIDRPLTQKGTDRASAAFKNFLKKFDPPKAVITSGAVRSVETASILSELCGVKYEIVKRLNPGADIKDYIETISDWRHAEVIAIVGHEPELSGAVSFITSGGYLRLTMKKGSICVLDGSVLVDLLQQKALL